MSNLESLIDNALRAQQRTLKKEINSEDAWKGFKRDWKNVEMAKESKVNLDDIWDIALYVTQIWNGGKII